jgi:hypothetical protein
VLDQHQRVSPLAALALADQRELSVAHLGVAGATQVDQVAPDLSG